VTFTLPGFTTVRREGVEVTGAFVATINADMRVGAIEETIQSTFVSVPVTETRFLISKIAEGPCCAQSGDVANASRTEVPKRKRRCRRRASFARRGRSIVPPGAAATTLDTVAGPRAL
jgi:hypothetical protein